MARVVVVEDSPVTRQLLVAIVEAAGHELLAACDNGLAGLQAIQQLRPDVALLDMLLPQLDGVQVMQRLQQLGLAVPVIMLSSVTAADRIQAARAAGVRHYLLKPFDAQKVMATLERVLHGGTGPLGQAPAAPAPAGANAPVVPPAGAPLVPPAAAPLVPPAGAPLVPPAPGPSLTTSLGPTPPAAPAGPAPAGPPAPPRPFGPNW